MLGEFGGGRAAVGGLLDGDLQALQRLLDVVVGGGFNCVDYIGFQTRKLVVSLKKYIMC